MVSEASTDGYAIIDKIDPSLRRLPHPVELLTADQISDVAEIPKSTILSAAADMDEIRSRAFASAIRQLGTSPGPSVWEALRVSLKERESVADAVETLMRARLDELSDDPALCLLLSGFESLDDDRVRQAVVQTCHELVDGFVPFLETVADTFGQRIGPTGSTMRSMLLIVLLGSSLARRVSDDASAEPTYDRFTIKALCQFFDTDPDGTVRDGDVDVLPPLRAPGPPVEGNLGQAVAAAAGLLLSGGVPVRFGMKLGDVLSQTGLSTAGFYRQFGSMAGFERALLERADSLVGRAMDDDFYEDILEFKAAGPSREHSLAEHFLAEASVASSEYVATTRPFNDVLPWLGSWVGSSIIVPAYSEVFVARGKFLEALAARSELEIVRGIEPTDLARIFFGIGVVVELVARIAPEPQRALRYFMVEQGQPIFASFFRPA